MKLTQFLAAYPASIHNRSVCFITAPQAQPLFVASLLTRIKREYACPFEVIDCASMDFAHIFAALQTTFLGMQTVYVLKNVSELEAKKQTSLLDYLMTYQGPHTVWVTGASSALPAKTAGQSQSLAIELPETLGLADFTLLMHWLHGEQAVKRTAQCTRHIFAATDTVPLDQACMIAAYALLMGNSYQDFLSSWLPSLLVPEKSLFLLSQHFFAKSSKKFLTSWAQVANDYSEQFWITFWSEQLWRSYHYCALMQQSKYADAKAIAFRLPFSLLNHDWKKLQLAELKAAHDFLYSCDGMLKNGGGVLGLDLFYTKFLTSGF